MRRGILSGTDGGLQTLCSGVNSNSIPSLKLFFFFKIEETCIEHLLRRNIYRLGVWKQVLTS